MTVLAASICTCIFKFYNLYVHPRY